MVARLNAARCGAGEGGGGRGEGVYKEISDRALGATDVVVRQRTKDGGRDDRARCHMSRIPHRHRGIATASRIVKRRPRVNPGRKKKVRM